MYKSSLLPDFDARERVVLYHCTRFLLPPKNPSHTETVWDKRDLAVYFFNFLCILGSFVVSLEPHLSQVSSEQKGRIFFLSFYVYRSGSRGDIQRTVSVWMNDICGLYTFMGIFLLGYSWYESRIGESVFECIHVNNLVNVWLDQYYFILEFFPFKSLQGYF